MNKPIKKKSVEALSAAERLEADKCMSRDELITYYQYLCEIKTKEILRGVPINVPYEDLYGASVMGLVQAADKYSPEKGVTFSTFAGHRISGAILDYLRTLDDNTRSNRALKNKLEEFIIEIEKRTGETPTDELIAEKLGLTIDELNAVKVNLGGGIQNFSEMITDKSDPRSEPEFPDNYNETPEQIAEKEQIKNLLKSLGANLPEVHRRVLKHYYQDELSLTQIGQIFGFSQSRASQIHASALNELSERLAGMPALRKSLYDSLRSSGVRVKKEPSISNEAVLARINALEIDSEKDVLTAKKTDENSVVMPVRDHNLDGDKQVSLPSIISTSNTVSSTQDSSQRSVSGHIIMPDKNAIQATLRMKALLDPGSTKSWTERVRHNGLKPEKMPDFQAFSGGL